MEIGNKYFLLSSLLVVTPALCMIIPKYLPKSFQPFLQKHYLTVVFALIFTETVVFLFL